MTDPDLSTSASGGPHRADPAVADPPLFVLAMDHRDSLAKKVYDIDTEPDAAQVGRLQAGKALVFRGLQQALARGADRRHTAVLVDERYGAQVARDARAAGLVLAMPIERSGQDWFTLEYGALSGPEAGTWLAHLDEFDPDYAKVLVRDNPGLDADHRHRQIEDLAAVSAALAGAGRRLLLELVVPPTDAQQGDSYDADVRPGLTERILTEYQQAGVEPAIWKIEGLDRPEDATRIAAVARQGGRDQVRCIVLGRDAEQDELDRWLTVAAGVDGFCGFAIGRSIWQEPLADELAGRLDDDAAAAEIADRYQHYISTWRSAAG